MIHKIEKPKIQPVRKLSNNYLSELILSSLKNIFEENKSKDFAHKEKIFFRIEIPIEKINFTAWLANQNQGIKTFWASRKLNFKMAGIGAADIVCGNLLENYSDLFQRLNEYLSDESNYIRYYGGFGFYKTKIKDTHWNPFGSYRFIIPRFEILFDTEKWLFAFNSVFNNYSEIEDQLAEIDKEIRNITWNDSIDAEQEITFINRANFPDSDDWKKMINSALDSINRNEIEKIVLARKTRFEFTEEINPFVILNRLITVNPDSLFFGFQPEANTSFIGATPELLYRRNGNTIYSEAIAGTRRRGRDPVEDNMLENELLNSDKDLREHDFVIQSVKFAMQKICSSVSGNNRVSTIKLARLQHLFTNFEGRLKEEIDDARILSVLHPTPAVGGSPTKEALLQIKELEPFDRGWYAAPVGWLSFDSAEFAVAIRSGLFFGNELFLFSGAGIVPGSQAQAEWEEIESKIGNFLKVLEINGDSNGKYQQSLGFADYSRADQK